jgi:tape measure domain-containing protein
MNTREMRLIVRAQNQTAGAFHEVASDLVKVAHETLQLVNMTKLLHQVGQQCFTDLGNLVQRTAGTVGRGLTGIGVHVHRLNALFRDLRGAAREGLSGLSGGGGLGGALSGLLGLGGGPLGLVSAAFSGLQTVFGPLLGAVQGLAQAGATAAGAGLAALTGALTLAAKQGVDMNITLDASRLSLTRLTGSSRGAAMLIAGLRKEALSSMLTFKELLPLSQSLAAAYGPAGMGRILPTLRAFGDAAAALRVDSEGLGRALLAFRQILGKPFLQGEEVLQLIENLPGANVSQILQQQLGTADTDLLKKAGISGREVGAAIVAGLQSQFGGAQAALADLFPMVVSAIQDSLNDLWGTVTRGLTDRLTAAGRFVRDFLGSLQATAQGQALLSGLAGAFDRVGDTIIRLAHLLPGLLQGLGPFAVQFTQGIAGLVSALGRLAGSQRIVQGLLTPFTLLARALESLGAQGDRFAAWVEKIINPENVERWITNLVAGVQTLLDLIGMLTGGQIGEGIAALFDAKNIVRFLDTLSNGFEYLVRGISGIGRAWDEVVLIFKSGLFAVALMFQDLAENISLWFQETFTRLAQGFRGLIANALDALASGIQSLAGPLGAILQRMGVDVGGAGTMRAAALALRNPGALAAENQGLLDARSRMEATQAARWAGLSMVDPRFGQPLPGRLAGAFTGQTGETAGQDFILGLLGLNRRSIQAALFGAALAAGPAFAGPPPHMLLGAAHAAATVTVVQQPQIPSMPGAGGGGPTIPGLPPGLASLAPDLAALSPRDRVAHVQLLANLEKQVDALKAGAGAWDSIVEGAKLYAKSLGDSDVATGSVLQAMLGQARVLRELGAGAARLVQFQAPFSKEWAESLKTVNETATALEKVQNAMRDLLFDTTRLSAATKEAGALFELGKDAGFSSEQMQALAASQQQLLLQTLSVDSARLSTLQAGTEEWFKQRTAIIQTVSEIVKLRKELDSSNSLISRQNLVSFRAATPFGVRGTGPERGLGIPPGGSELAGFVNQLLGAALNPTPMSLEALLSEQGMAGLAGPGAEGYPPIVANNSFNIEVTATDYQAVRRQVLDDVDARLSQVLDRIQAAQQDRRGFTR